MSEKDWNLAKVISDESLSAVAGGTEENKNEPVYLLETLKCPHCGADLGILLPPSGSAMSGGINGVGGICGKCNKAYDIKL